MKENQKAVLISRLAREMDERGNWTGETHLQKAVYLLEELTGVPLGFDFTLYKHGPFSFDLRQELNRLSAEALLRLVPQPYPYGPSFRATEAGGELEERFPKTLHRYEKAINFVADLIGTRSASELERLGTALYLLRDRGTDDLVKLAREFNEIKPHVSFDSAYSALDEMKNFLTKAPKVAFAS